MLKTFALKMWAILAQLRRTEKSCTLCTSTESEYLGTYLSCCYLGIIVGPDEVALYSADAILQRCHRYVPGQLHPRGRQQRW
jgi:hypothetical protein